MDFLHGLSVVRAPRVGCLDAMAEVVFHAVEHDGGVVDGINMGSREGEGPLNYVRYWSLSSVTVRIGRTWRARPCCMLANELVVL